MAIISTRPVRQFGLQEEAIKRSVVRILVVDDFAEWRSWILEKLRENRSLQVVGAACDGRQAVLKAKELQPDLVLLDIGLPELNGIGAARQIRKVAPESKILFLSQEHDPDIALAALSVGGTVTSLSPTLRESCSSLWSRLCFSPLQCFPPRNRS